jgi:predicted enzyme related to lactoylglutathione lyase
MTTPTSSGTSTPSAVTPGAPCWTDLATSDLEGAERFYGEVLGWSAQHMGPNFGGYVNFLVDGDPVAGMMGNSAESGFPDAWTLYLACADARATVQAARDAGAEVVIEATDVMDLGVMALVRDVAGASIGLWQAGTFPGFQARGRAGAPVWHELHTRDHAGSVRFYEQAFGWKTSVMSDTDEFRYTVLVDDAGTELAGIMDASAYQPAGTRALWQTYWGAADVDAALATVERLGGKVLEPAQDTPFGRLARAADPTGATFKLSSLQSASAEGSGASGSSAEPTAGS